MYIHRPLGYARTGLGDLVSLLQAIPGEAGAEQYIQAQAKAGAEAAIPDIQAQIMPYLVGALVLSLGSFLLSISAYRATHPKKGT